MHVETKTNFYTQNKLVSISFSYLSHKYKNIVLEIKCIETCTNLNLIDF